MSNFGSSAAGGNSADGAMLSSTPPEIEVYDSGSFVDLLNPDPSTITLDDIARGLAFTCRYGGAGISRFYSVAEHSVLVHDLMLTMGCDRPSCLAGLFHDAAEAYLGDIVSPLKWAMREETAELVEHGRSLSPYDTLSERMDRAIASRFRIDVEAFDLPDVCIADMWALRIEATALTKSGGAHWRWPGRLPNRGEKPADLPWVGGRDPEDARRHWLDLADCYSDELNGLT